MKQINKYLYRVSSDDFQRIPGSPIAYWVSYRFSILFNKNLLRDVADPKMGMRTGNNDRFLRFWQEVEYSRIGFGVLNAFEASASQKKWFPYQKGGTNKKWYGNQDYLVNWEHDGLEIKELTRKTYPQLGDNLGWKITNENYYFREGGGWSALTSGAFSMRYYPSGFIFDTKGQCLFAKTRELLNHLIGMMNSILIRDCLQILAPTLDFNSGPVSKVPFLNLVDESMSMNISNVKQLIIIGKSDWDSYETSWDFTSLPLLDACYRGDTLASTYSNLRAHWNEMTLEMQRLEEENNRIFIEAYGLEDELTPDVPLKEITLTCNPYYRYGNNKSDSELEDLLLADTMKELISYAVGCMFGRYSLDKPGLILANQGETYEDYCRLVPNSSFPADEDNAIPVLDGDWFSDDIVSRFRKFLRVAFGEEKYEENLRFIEAALGKDLRQYFLRDFYNDHVKRYKKRPIYWMFSSPDGSFNVLIYMHRYRPDTASIILSEYLREYQVRLSAYMDNLRRKEANPDLSKGEKVKALKELDKLRKTQDSLTAYERDILFPLANQRIEIDLDDGVKVNYPKFGVALKKIAGLEAKDEE